VSVCVFIVAASESQGAGERGENKREGRKEEECLKGREREREVSKVGGAIVVVVVLSKKKDR
jgi:hypothetical protein